MKRSHQDPHAAGSQFERWLMDLKPEELLGEFRRLHAKHLQLQSELEQADGRAAQAELKLDALELDAQRVHRLLDEFEVPRHLEPDAGLPRAQQSEGDNELSLLGRIELVLEDEEE